MLYTLKNDFHSTTVSVRISDRSTRGRIDHTVEITLSRPQIKQARKILCGMPDCTCQWHPCGIRGPQVSPGGQQLIVSEE